MSTTETKTPEQRLLAEMKRQAIRDAAAKAIDRLRRYVDPDAVGCDGDRLEARLPLDPAMQEAYERLCSAHARACEVFGSLYWDDTRPPALEHGHPAFDAMQELLVGIPDSSATVEADGTKEFPSPLAALWRTLYGQSREDEEKDVAPDATFWAGKRQIVEAIVRCIEVLRDDHARITRRQLINAPWVQNEIKRVRDMDAPTAKTIEKYLSKWESHERDEEKRVQGGNTQQRYFYDAARRQLLMEKYKDVSFPHPPS